MSSKRRFYDPIPLLIVQKCSMQTHLIVDEKREPAGVTYIAVSAEIRIQVCDEIW
jgi:hypothetical protein